jgi:hypothetical protein
MRSTLPEANVSEIAEHFGGGGHIQASGFKIRDKSFSEAEKEIVQYIKNYQEKRLGVTPATSDNQATSPTFATPIPKKNIAEQVNEQIIGVPKTSTGGPLPTEQNKPQTIPSAEPKTEQKSWQPQAPANMSNMTPMDEPRKKRRRRRRRKPENSSEPSISTNTQPIQNRVETNTTPKQAIQPEPTNIIRPTTPTAIPKVETIRQNQPAPATPEQAKQAPEVIQSTEPQTQSEKPVTETPKKPVFDPFNPPNPDESDILAALSRL